MTYVRRTITASSGSGGSFDPSAAETITGQWGFDVTPTISGVAAATTTDATNAAGNVAAQTMGVSIESAGLYPSRGSGFAFWQWRGTDDPAALTPPSMTAPSTATTGGTLAAATYFYKITATRATVVAGETTASLEQSVTTTGSTSTVSLSWAAIAGASGYKIYRSTSNGTEVLTHTITSGATTSYTDAGDAAGTVQPPSVNGTGALGGDEWVNLS